jgi:hypothetical protein
VTVFARRQADGTLVGIARYLTDGIVRDSTGRWMWERYPTAAARLQPAACDAASP